MVACVCNNTQYTTTAGGNLTADESQHGVGEKSLGLGSGRLRFRFPLCQGILLGDLESGHQLRKGTVTEW